MERPGWSGSPSARATATGTTSGSVIGARSTYHTPSPNSPASCGRDLDRQPGFAHPARAGQRHHPVLSQQLPQLGQLRVATQRNWSAAPEDYLQQQLSTCAAAGTR